MPDLRHRPSHASSRPAPGEIGLRAWVLALGILATCGAAIGQPATSPAARAASATSTTPRVAADGPRWRELSAEQRTALAPLARDWDTIDAPRKTKWLELAARFPKMPPAEQQRVQARMTDWARLTPSERGRARLTFQETKQIPPERKQARWEAYQALPPEQRRELAERARSRNERSRTSASPASAAAQSSAPHSASAPLLRPVTPTVVQARPGATTTLMTQAPKPPLPQHPGRPTIAAQPGQVDKRTLLPRTGPQAAASGPQQR